MGCRSRSRTTSIRPIFRQPAERPHSRRIARNATHRSCSTCSMPAPSCSAKPICKSLPMVRPTTTRRLVRRATPTIPRASRAARAAVAPPLSQRASRRPPSARIPAGPSASLPHYAGSRACARPPCAGHKPASFRFRIPVTPPDRWRVRLPTACSSTASLPAVRPRSRPLLSKGFASACRATISGKSRRRARRDS